MSPPAELERPGAEAPVPAAPSAAPWPRLAAIGARASALGPSWHLAAAALFAASAATVLWQNGRAAVLFDLSYVLENGWRIAAGDVPYRDFPLPHAPGTFLLQALVVKLFDASFITHAVYCALIGGASAVITLKILEVQLEPHFRAFRLLALVIAAPLVVVNVYAIYPHPFYDPDACFFVLLALWALIECPKRDYPQPLCFAAGALLVVPIFVKQNIGVAFFALTHLALLSLVLEGPGRARKGWWWMIAGSAAAGVVVLLLIQLTAGLDNYWNWTVAYPASRSRFQARADRMVRVLNVKPVIPLKLVEAYMHVAIWVCVALSLLGFMLARHSTRRRGALIAAVALTALGPLWIVAKELRWDIGAGLPPANLVTFWPYLCALSILVLVLTWVRTPFGFPLLLPIVLVGTAEASFLSQGAAGSSYGIFPLLVLLQGFVVVAFLHPEHPRSTRAAWAFALVGAACLTAAGYAYIARNERLLYADVAGSSVHRSTHPRLNGMASSGEYLADLDRLLEWVEKNVPASEPVMTIPGEDPFFYALRRPPRMPVLLLETTTLNPYTDPQLVELARERGILWVVHKTKVQCCSTSAEVKGLLPLLLADFRLVHEIGPYRIYRRSTPAR